MWDRNPEIRRRGPIPGAEPRGIRVSGSFLWVSVLDCFFGWSTSGLQTFGPVGLGYGIFCAWSREVLEAASDPLDTRHNNDILQSRTARTASKQNNIRAGIKRHHINKNITAITIFAVAHLMPKLPKADTEMLNFRPSPYPLSPILRVKLT